MQRVGHVGVNVPESTCPIVIRKYVQVLVAAAVTAAGGVRRTEVAGCAAAPRPLPVMLPVDQTLLQVVRAIKAPGT